MKDSRITKVFIISILLLLFLLGLIYLSRHIVVPFIIAGILCYLISPIINKIMLLGIRRWVAVSFVTILIITIFVFIVTLLIPIAITEINTLTQNHPKYEMLFKEQCNDFFEKVPFLKKYTDTFIHIEDTGDGFVDLMVAKLQTLPQHITSLVSMITIIVLIPVITFFMLLGINKAKNAIIEFIPAKHVEVFISFIYEVNFVLGGYIRGQIIEVFFVAIATTLILVCFNVNYAIIIGVVSGLFNIIPYLGPAVAMVLGILATAIEYKSFTLVLEVFIALEIVQQVDGHVVQPLIVGKNVNLSPVMMIFALLFGANIGGIIGMIVSVPAFAILKNIFVIVVNRYRKNLIQ